jgi:hypothetical protein
VEDYSPAELPGPPVSWSFEDYDGFRTWVKDTEDRIAKIAQTDRGGHGCDIPPTLALAMARRGAILANPAYAQRYEAEQRALFTAQQAEGILRSVF